MKKLALAASAASLLAFATLSGFAQDSAPVLASGLTEKGTVEAQVVDATRSGDILTIKVRFKPLSDKVSESLYGSISKSSYENEFYLLAGGKKYLLLTDSEDKPLASPSVYLKATKDAPFAGSWYGRFPAPPADIKDVALTLPGIEPMEPIAITDR